MSRTQNNFDGIRIGLAFIVFFAHVGALVQTSEFYWFTTVFNSDFAVKGFFAISGFLVTRSYLSSKTMYDYAGKRFRRIWPAYIAVVIACFAFGGYLTTIPLGNYLSSSESIKYLFANAALLNFIQPTLPGVFLDNPMHAVNGALWTIKVEVMLYGCVPLLVFLWGRTHAMLYALGIVFFSISWVLCFKYGIGGAFGEEISRQFPGQLSYFALGSLLSVRDHWRPMLKWTSCVLLPLLYFAAEPVMRVMVEPFAYSVIIIWLGTSRMKLADFGKFGDISYGVYLCHFPIIQTIIAIGFFRSWPWGALLLAIALTIVVSLISWHLIEIKVLRRNSHYVQAAN